MLAKLLVLFLLISVFVASGCVEQAADTGTEAGVMTEDQAAGLIEQEMEAAVENMSVEDIEDSLGE